MLIGVLAGIVCLAFLQLGTRIPNWWFGGFTITTTFVVGAAASLCIRQSGNGGV
jgi:hypothetical protein